MRKEHPCVSVIVPAYNAEKTLKKCIRSVASQDYDNFEIIIVDDGSEDGTAALCDQLKTTFSYVKVIHSVNQGVSCARNLGLEMAAGDYILFLDADDCLTSGALRILAAYSDGMDWVIGNYWMIPEKGQKKIYHQQYFSESVHYGNPDELPELAERRLFHFVWGRLYDRRLIRQFHLKFDEKLTYGEDLIFNTQYFIHIQKFVVLKQPVYQYHCHLTMGLSHQIDRNEWKIQQKLCCTMQKILQTADFLNSETIERMNHFYYSQCIASIERTVAAKNYKMMKKICRSDFFKHVLDNEKKQHRIHRMDYFLLENRMGVLYCLIHRIYVNIKDLKGLIKK